MTVVVDASLVMAALANRKADDVLHRRLVAARTLHAPTLIDAEVASGVRGLLLGRKVGHARAAQMLTDFADLRITRHPMPPYVPRVLELRSALTAYDAFYVALAEAVQLPLLTKDTKLARSSGHRAEIHIHP
jgi:predicted nucleic acid-binding protein